MSHNGHKQVLVGTDRPYPLVDCALRALAREGVECRRTPPDRGELTCRWARRLAECVAAGECSGGVLFCEDAGLVACVANKVPGLRAVPVTTIGQTARAVLSLGANLLAVEMPGRTYFEIRQILRELCCSGGSCPDGVGRTLEELDGHAHRNGDRNGDPVARPPQPVRQALGHWRAT